jgi:hypothetical protein
MERDKLLINITKIFIYIILKYFIFYELSIIVGNSTLIYKNIEISIIKFVIFSNYDLRFSLYQN